MEIDEKTLVEVIARVVKECMGEKAEAPFVKEVDKSGIIKVETASVTCEPFGGQPGVYLRDILSLDEAPRMGAGVMELDQTCFEWTLTYDEYDYVIAGELEIKIDGRTVKGSRGDIIYIPSGSHICFCTPTTARYAYFVYPADWQS